MVDIHNIGLIVEVNGIRGAILTKDIRSVALNLDPNPTLEERSHLLASGEIEMKLQGMKDKELLVKIIELSAKHHRFLLSERI